MLLPFGLVLELKCFGWFVREMVPFVRFQKSELSDLIVQCDCWVLFEVDAAA